MRQNLLKAARTGDLSIFDKIRNGEVSDADILPINDASYNIIHIACQYGKEEFIHEAFCNIKPEILAQLIAERNIYGSNALHAAAWYECTVAAKIQVDFYRRWVQDTSPNTITSPDPKSTPIDLADHRAPWILVPNKYARTPVHDALFKGQDEMACYIFLLDPLYIYDKVDADKASPLYLALNNQCSQFIELILSQELNLPGTSASFSAPDGTALHQAIINEYAGRTTVSKMVDKLKGKDEIIWQYDSKGWTALHYAVERGVDWQIELLLQKLPRSNFFMFNQNSESPLLLAWKNGHHWAIQTILRLCPAMIEWRSENNATLLHHIKLQSREEYQQILEIPETQRILNITDNNKMTPLHQAISDGNVVLAELLFEMAGVNKAIQNNEGKTPIDLLIEKSYHSAEFAELCERPGILPRASYLSIRADLKEVRSTVMVVAALLATITFQAAFTIPDATEKRLAAFIIYLVADTGALCCSLVVMFWLIWAMIEDDFQKSRILADRSFFLLEMSFYLALLAFTATVFAIASEKSLPLAVAITVICCMVPVMASKTIASRIFKVQEKQSLC